MSTRKNAKYARVYLNGVLLAECYEGSLDHTQKNIESMAWGDSYPERTTIGADWTATFKRYRRTGNTCLLATAGNAATGYTSDQFTITIWESNNNCLLQGPCVCENVNIMLPESGFCTEEVKFSADGAPTYLQGTVG